MSNIDSNIYINHNSNIDSNIDINHSNLDFMSINTNQIKTEELTADDIHKLMKARYEAMTKEELINDKKNLIRCFRNQKLVETDKYINQTDRFNSEQIEELKNYRQILREYMNITDFSLDVIEPLPEIPNFILNLISINNSSNIYK
jgi:hypothetical protein